MNVIKICFTLCVLVCLNSHSLSQDRNNFISNTLQRNFITTGDLKGISFGVSYGHAFGSRFYGILGINFDHGSAKFSLSGGSNGLYTVVVDGVDNAFENIAPKSDYLDRGFTQLSPRDIKTTYIGGNLGLGYVILNKTKNKVLVNVLLGLNYVEEQYIATIVEGDFESYPFVPTTRLKIYTPTYITFLDYGITPSFEYRHMFSSQFFAGCTIGSYISPTQGDAVYKIGANFGLMF